MPRRLCWPFWDLWFNLKYYLDSVSQVRAGHDLRGQISSHRAQAIQRKLCLIMSILVIRCLQLGVLSLVDLSPFTRMLNHDYIMYFDCPKEVNLSPMTFGLQTICFTYRMYWFDFHRAFEPILIVQRVLFRSWNGCFLEKRVEYRLQSVAISRMVYLYSASNLNVFKYFYAIAFAVTAVYNFYWIRNLSENWTYFLLDFPEGPLSLTYALCNSLLTNFYMIAFTMVNVTFTTIIFTFTLCMFIRLKQANKLFQNSSLSPYKFGKFCSFHTETLTKIIAGNRYFGQMLLDFIVIYMPINIYCFTEMILGHFGLIATLICINVIAFHYLVLFGFHLLAAMYSARIHKCSYILMHWSARAQFSRQLGTRLKLANYICAFHTEKRYGISYGEIGLISFDSFAKVIAFDS